MSKTTFRKLILEAFAELVKEDMEIPSQDGTAEGASPEDQDKAKKAAAAGETIKFVKPGELEESGHPDLDKKPSEESGMEPIEEEEVAPKVKEVFAKLQELAAEVGTLEEFADTNSDKKMKKLSEKLAKHLYEATKVVSELRETRDAILQEDAEKASIFADKVIAALGKFIKDEAAGKKLKEKYMVFIAKAHKKGKSAKDVAERIKAHRFEL